MSMSSQVTSIFEQLGLTGQLHAVAIGSQWQAGKGPSIDVFSPIDGAKLVDIQLADQAQLEETTTAAHSAFLKWRVVPGPIRGEFVRRIGMALRKYKEPLSALVTIECGKILEEGRGEVQEMIDICDFAVGISRQLYGKTMPSERPSHRLTEQWHPLGPVGVISAFNFPVAVWAWNAMLALVCGDPIVWKPSEKTPLTALACQAIFNMAASEMSEVPEGLSSVIVGDAEIGKSMAASTDLPLVSATGSVPMGKSVAATVGARLGKTILELGGNNAMIVTESADLELAIRAIVFSAAGTCGQRCTSLRRLIAHAKIASKLVPRIEAAFESISIGNPLETSNLVGPLIDQQAFENMQETLAKAKEQGGKVTGGERILESSGGYYVRPAVVQIDASAEILQHETFAPILFVVQYENLEDAIAIQNNVPQGLSSAIFTSNVRESELFVAAQGSDCGIANVNIGTSGAEIGGAFGGEKETGGGRESGSDSWKAYMRRATNTINYSTELPLAQGIKFDI